jgi:hypothetical protein
MPRWFGGSCRVNLPTQRHSSLRRFNPFYTWKSFGKGNLFPARVGAGKYRNPHAVMTPLWTSNFPRLGCHRSGDVRMFRVAPGHNPSPATVMGALQVSNPHRISKAVSTALFNQRERHLAACILRRANPGLGSGDATPPKTSRDKTLALQVGDRKPLKGYTIRADLDWPRAEPESEMVKYCVAADGACGCSEMAHSRLSGAQNSPP